MKKKEVMAVGEMWIIKDDQLSLRFYPSVTSMILRADNPFWIFKRVFIEQLTMIQSPLYSLLDERLYIFPPLHTVDLSGFLLLKPSCEEFENFKRWYTAASQTLLQGTSVTLRLVVYTKKVPCQQ